MIREAVRADVGRITAMMSRLSECIGGPDLFDPAYFSLTVDHLIRVETGLALVLDIEGAVEGFLIAEVGSSRMTPATIAQELAFWIEEDARGRWGVRFLQALETWAREQGAAVIGITSQSFNPRADRLFERAGYRPVETRHVKRI